MVIPVIRCEALSRLYGSRLKGVILYGSMARGGASPGSDIDLLVLLSPPFDYFAEMRQKGICVEREHNCTKNKLFNAALPKTEGIG